MLQLGRSKRREIALNDEERSRHLLMLGASGTGKSKLLEHMVRQDILAGRGLCLLDPHGSLADDIVAWCASRGLAGRRKIRVIEVRDLAWSAGFNPLRLAPGTEPTTRVDAMIAACAQVWGGENMANMPRLKKTLRAVFYALMMRNLTLVEAPLLTTGTLAAVRERLTAGLSDHVFATLWSELNSLSRREFVEVFESTNNRLGEFLSAPAVRRIIGQTGATFDARRAMDEGEIVIVNLLPGTALSADNARLIGTMLVSEFRLCVLQRDVTYAKQHPFTLFIDECHDYLTEDIVKSLDQTRKFGLHLVLSLQRLGQMQDRGAAIFNGVMTGGQTKIVFGGLTDDDAGVMAREIFRSSFNLERPKHSLDKLQVVDEVPYWLESESETSGGSETSNLTNSSSTGESAGLSEALSGVFDLENELLQTTLTTGLSNGMSQSHSIASGTAAVQSWSHTRGRSQTLKPVREVLPTALHSLDEEEHLAIVKLRELPRQAAIVKRRGQMPVRFRPPDIKTVLAPDSMTARFTADVRAATPFVRSTCEIDALIAERGAEWQRGGTEGNDAEEAFWNE